MARRIVLAAVCAMAMLVALASSAVAGGWATVEIEKPVTRTEVDEPVTIEFTLLQHGVTPVDWTTTYLTATNADTGETMRVDATNGKEVGQWSVVVAFPSAGNWDWAIRTEELEVQGVFAELEVVSDSAAAASNSGSITQAQLDSAISGATEPLQKQIASMASELETLQKQVTSLTGERDALQKQITSLSGERDILQKQIAAIEDAQAADSSSGTSWWLAAIVGATSALIVAGGLAAVAFRRGLVRRPELAPATA